MTVGSMRTFLKLLMYAVAWLSLVATGFWLLLLWSYRWRLLASLRLTLELRARAPSSHHMVKSSCFNQTRARVHVASVCREANMVRPIAIYIYAFITRCISVCVCVFVCKHYAEPCGSRLLSLLAT